MRIFTQNCYGPPLIAPYRKERFWAIAEAIREEDDDFICLQEVILPQDLHIFEIPGYHMSYVPRWGRQSGGLVTLSKEKPSGSWFRQYTRQGGLKQWSDRLLGKGLLHTAFKEVIIINTHLLATYGMYEVSRANLEHQLEEFLGHVLNEAYVGKPIVAAGDFNFGPQSELYAKLSQSMHDLTEALNLPKLGLLAPYPQKLDYIKGSKHISKKHQEYRHYTALVHISYGYQEIPVSDHPGVAAEFDIIKDDQG